MSLFDDDTQPILVPRHLKENEFVCADCDAVFDAVNPPGQTCNRFCPKCAPRHYPGEGRWLIEWIKEEERRGLLPPLRKGA